MYPDLNTFRRAVVPIFERNEEDWFGTDIMFSKSAQDRCFAGVLKDSTPSAEAEKLQKMKNIYPCNLAALKYKSGPNGRVYERAGYAERPEGFFGLYQHHFRMFPCSEGVAVFAHHEKNPWVRPKDHYSGDEWNPAKGIERARELFELDTDIAVDEVTFKL